MVQKLPPPPSVAINDPELNRWFLELTAILQNSGGIDPGSVPGLTDALAQVALNTAAITALQTGTGNNSSAIAVLQFDVSLLFGAIATINSNLTTLNARAQVLSGAGAPAAGLGNVNDWYGNIGGAAGARVYIKTAPAVWTPFPF